MNDDMTRAALELIQSQSTLTLATAAENSPWSAPVYYVFLNGCFYFFSAPHSRHIRQALASGSAAASLYHRDDSWRKLRGLQMGGEIRSVRSPAAAMKAVSAYVKRFEFVSEFFKDLNAPTAADFFSRFKVRLYSFRPATVYFMDNRKGFGSRQHVELTPSF